MRTFSLASAALFSVLLLGCSAPKQLQTTGSEKLDYGYGSTSKDTNAYSIDQLNPSSQELSSYTSIYEYLRGKVPGVIVGPGDNPSIRIRGINSVNGSTDPLFIVDGSEVYDISYLNPADVASVTVLKDASASIYGVRGSNGVIIIKTRRN